MNIFIRKAKKNEYSDTFSNTYSEFEKKHMPVASTTHSVSDTGFNNDTTWKDESSSSDTDSSTSFVHPTYNNLLDTISTLSPTGTSTESPTASESFTFSLGKRQENSDVITLSGYSYSIDDSENSVDTNKSSSTSYNGSTYGSISNSTSTPHKYVLLKSPMASHNKNNDDKLNNAMNF